MAKSQTNQATNASGNLLNQAQGLAGPGGLETSFQNSLGSATATQGSEQTAAQAGIANAQQTGGYDPATLGQLQSGYANALGSANTLTSQGSNLATTGGFTPQQAQQFVEQGTEGVTTTGGILAQQLAQSKAATGGLGTGGGASQMARQLEQNQANATLNSQVALNQQQTSNTIAGMGAESAGVGAQTSALGGASNLAGGVASGVTAANSQMSQLYNTTTGQVTALGQQVLSSLGLDFSTQAAATNSLTQLSKNPGLLQTTLGDLAGLGGAAAGAAGSLGVQV